MTNGDRRMNYHSLGNVQESTVLTSVLRNNSRAFMANPMPFPEAFTTYPFMRPSQSGPEAMLDDGVMFFTLIAPKTIACWNSKKEYNKENTPTVVSVSVPKEFLF